LDLCTLLNAFKQTRYENTTLICIYF
jgi:hypothetical protein